MPRPPVAAVTRSCPPSTLYRFRKFARRHRIQVTAAASAVDIDDAFQGSLGSRIRIAMAERNITKAMLARETGMSPGVIARAIENPERHTAVARDVIPKQLIKEPTDYIESCQRVIEAAGGGPTIRPLVATGRRRAAYGPSGEANFQHAISGAAIPEK